MTSDGAPASGPTTSPPPTVWPPRSNGLLPEYPPGWRVPATAPAPTATSDTKHGPPAPTAPPTTAPAPTAPRTAEPATSAPTSAPGPTTGAPVPAAPPAAAVPVDTDLGNSLAVGDTLGTGFRLTSDNDLYSLGLTNGNLVLSGPDGRTLWESGTSDANGKVLWATMGADGSLDVQADAHYQALTKWSTQAGLKNAGSLRLNDDGSLVVIGKDGKTILATLAPADTVKHLYLVQLNPPLGSPPVLRTALESAQLWLQDVVDLMGVGKAAEIPDFRKLLSNAGLADTRNTGEMVDAYSSKLDAFGTVKKALRGNDVDVNVTAGQVAEQTARALGEIKNLIEDLKDILRLPQLGKDAPAAVRADPGDFEYSGERDGQGGLVKAEMSRPAVEYVMGALFECVDGVSKVFRRVIADAERARKQIDPPAPRERGDADGPTRQRPPGPPPSTPGPAPSDPRTPAPVNPDQPPRSAPGPTDYRDLYKDLLGGPSDGGKAGSDVPVKTDSDVVKAIDAAIARIESSAYSTAPAPGINTADRPRAQPEARNEQVGLGGPRTGGGGSTAGAANGGGVGGGGNMLSGLLGPVMMLATMLPTLMESLKQRETDSERDDDAEDREVSEGDPNQPVPASPGGPEQVPTTDPPPVTAPVTDAGSPPPVNGKTMVDLPLDGTNQRVSSVVAQAVQRELNNPNGSDALAAYQGTPGEESANSRWAPVGDAQLRTGDVIRWADRSALVVVLNDGPRMIVNGKLIPLSSEGDFRGYFHPTGADVGGEPASRDPLSTV
ncbi:hypothetical protein ACWDOP_15040 [Nocardia sp. NPDC003693]